MCLWVAALIWHSVKNSFSPVGATRTDRVTPAFTCLLQWNQLIWQNTTVGLTGIHTLVSSESGVRVKQHIKHRGLKTLWFCRNVQETNIISLHIRCFIAQLLKWCSDQCSWAFSLPPSWNVLCLFASQKRRSTSCWNRLSPSWPRCRSPTCWRSGGGRCLRGKSPRMIGWSAGGRWSKQSIIWGGCKYSSCINPFNQNMAMMKSEVDTKQASAIAFHVVWPRGCLAPARASVSADSLWSWQEGAGGGGGADAERRDLLRPAGSVPCIWRLLFHQVTLLLWGSASVT